MVRSTELWCAGAEIATGRVAARGAVDEQREFREYLPQAGHRARPHHFQAPARPGAASALGSLPPRRQRRGPDPLPALGALPDLPPVPQSGRGTALGAQERHRAPGSAGRPGLRRHSGRLRRRRPAVRTETPSRALSPQRRGATYPVSDHRTRRQPDGVRETNARVGSQGPEHPYREGPTHPALRGRLPVRHGGSRGTLDHRQGLRHRRLRALDRARSASAGSCGPPPCSSRSATSRA
jgi:hypothetical protein